MDQNYTMMETRLATNVDGYPLRLALSLEYQSFRYVLPSSMTIIKVARENVINNQNFQ